MAGTATQLACARAAEATKLQRETYRAWRIVPDSSDAHPLPSGHADSLRAALDHALTGYVCHKDHVAILVTDTVTGKRMLHVHAIKRKSAPQYRWDPETKQHIRFHSHYPVEIFAVAVNEFVPVEPFVWKPGCDVVGRDDGVIEATSFNSKAEERT